MSIATKYEPVIGLEIHVQLSTHTKLFARDSTEFGALPNTNISAVSLAYPGTLPKVNLEAIRMAVKMGLVCGSSIAETTIFDRKNYFYPDLPKGYQVTQDRMPICLGGAIRFRFKGKQSSINLFKIHLEEDAGKLLHEEASSSYVDFNRAGVPLIEIVTKPELYEPEQASAVMEEVRKIVRFLGISDGNMQEGSLRCDANISLRPLGSETLGSKVEIKNLNSFKFVEKALRYEIARQIEILDRGEAIVSETRLFDSEKVITQGMRDKEELNDYRYFPEPDLPHIRLTDKMVEELREDIPRLSHEWFTYLVEELDMPAATAGFISESKDLCQYFDQASKYGTPRSLANWLTGPVQNYLNEEGIPISQLPIPAKKFGEFVAEIDRQAIPFTLANTVLFPELLKDPHCDIGDLLNTSGVLDKGGSELDQLVSEVLDRFGPQVTAYKKGKKNLFGLFMGEVMKSGNGKHNPHEVKSLLEKHLK